MFGDMGESMFWILDENGTPQKADLIEWGTWFESAERTTKFHLQTNVGETYISTIFLGIDHSFFRGPPLLFETMIFGGPLDHEQWRYATWKEAMDGHASAVAAADQAQEAMNAAIDDVVRPHENK